MEKNKEKELAVQQVPVVGQEPQIRLNNIDVYADAIVKFRSNIADLVNRRIISEQTATRIILDQEYGFFQQMVTIEYKPEQG
jgi:hypothetical protein